MPWAFFILCGVIIGVGVALNIWLRRYSRTLPLVKLAPETDEDKIARWNKEADAERASTQPGDDTIAMLCLCCNGAKGPDCICTADCGDPRCQAADPEEAHRG